jgi:two-component system sensor histidine kinase HydH
MLPSKVGHHQRGHDVGDREQTREMDGGAASGPRWRYWGLAIGLLAGAVDTAAMRAVGVPLEISGRDVSPLVAVYFGTSFAALGYLVGFLVEQRRRERRMAAVLQEQTETVAALRARLAQSEKLAALGQLAATIAHEVRNPLGVIRSAAQEIGEALGDGRGEGHQACSFITAEIDRLNGVISSLLAFARPLVVAPRPTAVSDLVERAALLAGRDLARKQLRLRRADAPGTPPVLADADLVTQALVDLLVNACEASPPESEVVLAARRVDDGVEIDVADRGPGVPEDLRERIFEPFFTTRATGTGLGLAVARQIAEAHGGWLRVAAAPGGGSRFTLSLPSAAGPALAA